MNTLFFGTPHAAVPALHALDRISDVSGVVTRDDAARGRSGTPEPSPVKAVATALGLDVHHPQKMKEIVPLAAAADLAVVVAYGRLIPASLLEAPRLGFVNLHFSLLPRWRGAAPVQQAVLGGDARTGVTLMQMDEGLDTGPIITSCATLIDDSENAGDLTERLALMAADVLTASVAPLAAGSLDATAQVESEATTAPQFSTDDARLDFSGDATALLRQIRAFSPRPGAWALLDGERFKILAARRLDAVLAPGTVDEIDGRVALGTPVGGVELVTVQAAGKPVMTADDWFNGRRRLSAELS